MEDYWGLGRTNGLNCTPPAIDDFPKDFFNEEERQAGAVVLHVLASLYLFAALAVVCDKYFVPAVEKICQALNMSNDVAGATFMAAATSAPELFVNVIGTFITEGDIGVGTIVGSAVFNILAVAACCGIGAGMVVPLDWWPLTRDCLAYGITVAILICIIHDERVEWYEALILVLLYIVYIAVMYYDKSFQKCAKGGVNQARSRSRSHNNSLTTEKLQDPESLEHHFPLRIEHFQQNGNIKNISHIDASNNELSSSVMALDIQKISSQSSPPSSILLSSLTKERICCDTQQQQQQQQQSPQSPSQIQQNQMNDIKLNVCSLSKTVGDAKSKIESSQTSQAVSTTPVTITIPATATATSTDGEITEKMTTDDKNDEKNNNDDNADNGQQNIDNDEGFSLIKYPKGKSCFRQTTWIVIWPIHLLFFFTIPDCERKSLKKLFPLTFLMCIIWIGSLSYMVAWMITIIGDTLKIPDSVMGITFLAAGTSVPEAVSSVIVAKQGHGSMGISNSIGSNTFDILLCLGLPWLIKAAFLPIEPGHHWVGINSAGLEYSAISLLSTLLMLYITFSWNKFKLDRKVGHACLIMYAVFLILASLIELNVFFRVNLPTCGR